ncbi:MAG: N-formylglutamate amidohydrolase [Rhizobiales bacterium]|nr:N-formylglutamate amidohydrolase [Hyphomicrobiales bacterium]
MASAFVFSSPHSGRYYPPHFLAASRLTPAALRKSEDSFVDDLFADVVGSGAALLAANYPRAYIDMNREPYELDPRLFRDPLPDFANTRSLRVLGGLGTIARIVSEAEEIYRRPLTLEEALERIDRLHLPYHDRLGELLDERRRNHGFAVLIDCHSMPSVSIPRQPGRRPDIVLGDRFGCSCSRRLTVAAMVALRRQDFEVVLNRPYAGGYITEHHGRPSRAVHALQIEIARDLYMSEATHERTAGFRHLKERLTLAMNELMACARDLFQPAAAE